LAAFAFFVGRLALAERIDIAVVTVLLSFLDWRSFANG
jgi:hypothetical protein